MKKELKQIHKDWFYNNPASRYSRFCRNCNHRVRYKDDDKYCGWYGEECIEAVRNHCPIPSAEVTMLMEIEVEMSIHNKRTRAEEKGGTIVPPSNFQFVSTQYAEKEQVAEKTPRPHGSARAHSREDTPGATPIFTQNCAKTDCPYYGHMATYCRVCGHTKHVIHNRHPDRKTGITEAR